MQGTIDSTWTRQVAAWLLLMGPHHVEYFVFFLRNFIYPGGMITSPKILEDFHFFFLRILEDFIV
uniref:Uncharacterized protein n=1 Tax=Arundo donax TaxID=35708 RepID=A0A0A9BWH7_ARUDO